MFGHHMVLVDRCYELLRLIKGGMVALSSSEGLLPRRSLPADMPLPRKSKSRLRNRRPPLLIHYHVFKNAGTSFKKSLIDALGETALASYDSPFPGGFISRRNLARFAARHPDVKVIATHQAAPPPPRIHGREVLSSILIRDPIARIRSMYAFERRQEATSKGAQKAKQLSFKEYVMWRLEDSPAVLCNYQVFFCSRNPRKEVLIAGPEQLDQAIANLDTITIVGTVARFNEWLGLGQEVLSKGFPSISLKVLRRNATEPADASQGAIFEHLVADLGEALAGFLLEHNQLDMRLHQIADALLTHRTAEHGLPSELLQAYDSVRQARRSSHGQTLEIAP